MDKHKYFNDIGEGYIQWINESKHLIAIIINPDWYITLNSN